MISSQEAYNKHKDSFSQIPKDETKIQKLTRGDVIGESEELSIVSTADRELLIKAGCPAEYIDTLDERIGAFSHASSIWENSEFTKSEAKKEWLRIEPKVYEMRQDFLDSLRHALRKNPDQLRYVSKISHGHGRRDLVMDFKDIAVLGRNNKAALEAIGFDVEQIDKASILHDTLSNLLSESNMSPGELAELKLLSRQAYTYLQEAVTEIRENGQYVFRNDPERVDLYKSDHFQRIGKFKGKSEKTREKESTPQ